MKRCRKALCIAISIVNLGNFELAAQAKYMPDKENSMTPREKVLDNLIEKGDYKTAEVAVRLGGANPNALNPIDQMTLFVKAFEKALIAHEDNPGLIVHIDPARAQIAIALAKAGGNIRNVERDAGHFLDTSGRPNMEHFANNEVAKDFLTFLQSLRAAALNR